MGSTVTVSGTVEAVIVGVEDWALDEEADHADHKYDAADEVDDDDALENVSAAATAVSRDEEVGVDVREIELEVQVVSLPY
jgi:hypothetical protein